MINSQKALITERTVEGPSVYCLTNYGSSAVVVSQSVGSAVKLFIQSHVDKVRVLVLTEEIVVEVRHGLTVVRRKERSNLSVAGKVDFVIVASKFILKSHRIGIVNPVCDGFCAHWI